MTLIAGLGGLAAGIVVMTLMRRRSRPAMILILAGMLAMFIGAARAHEGEDHDASATPVPAVRDLAQRLPDGGVFVPKSTQRILAIRTMPIESAAHRTALELPGRIIPDPNASGFVQSSVGGRLSPPPGGFPRLGTSVKKGDLLAYVTPPLQAIDVSDMRQRQGELDQQISIVERRLARYETLVPGGAIARTQLEDTRLELQGLKDRRARSTVAPRSGRELIAPVDGFIAEAPSLQDRSPSRTRSSSTSSTRPACGWRRSASIRFQSPECGGATEQRRTYPLAFRVPVSRPQSIDPGSIRVRATSTGLRAGQFVTVLAATDEQKTGFRNSRAALVRNANGQDVVFEHVAAERFEPRPVRSSRSTANASSLPRGSPRQAPCRSGRRLAKCADSTLRRTADVSLSRHPVVAQSPHGAGGLSCSGAARNLQRRPASGRRLSRPQQADRHHPDRIGRIGASGSRATR
jgi:hypothetical protein